MRRKASPVSSSQDGGTNEAGDHPQTKGFIDRIDNVYASAENSDGFVDRAPRRTERHAHQWGDPRANPRFFVEDLHPGAPATISLWDDLESVYAFAYYGRHAEALGKGKEWFVNSEWPFYVGWWVEDDHIPTRQDASQRLEHLHDHGSTPHAFDFKTPFDDVGKPWRMDRGKIRERSEVVKKFDEDNPTGL